MRNESIYCIQSSNSTMQHFQRIFANFAEILALFEANEMKVSNGLKQAQTHVTTFATLNCYIWALLFSNEKLLHFARRKFKIKWDANALEWICVDLNSISKLLLLIQIKSLYMNRFRHFFGCYIFILSFVSINLFCFYELIIRTYEASADQILNFWIAFWLVI